MRKLIIQYHLKLFLLCYILFVSQLSKIKAQAPSNDNCTSAIQINITNSGWDYGTFRSDTVDMASATLQTGEYIHNSQVANSKSIWFKFSLPTTRSVNLELKQPGTVLNPTDAGWTLFRTSTCLPGSADVVNPPILNIEGFTHECLTAGDYLIQVTGKILSTPVQKLFMEISTAPSSASEISYDYAINPYDFKTVSGVSLSPSTLNKNYEVGCQSIFQNETTCPTTAYNMSSWHIFTTDNAVDYIRFEITEDPWNTSVSGSRNWGIEVFEGNCKNDSTPDNGAGLTTIIPCTTLTATAKGQYAALISACVLKPATTYTIKLYHPEDYFAAINVRMYEMGVGATIAPNPLSIPSSNKLGTISYSTSYSVADYFSCNGLTSLNNCGSVVTDSILGGSAYYDMNTWVTFELSQDANVSFSIQELTSQPNPYIRIFNGDVTTGGCNLSIDTTFTSSCTYNCMAAGKYSVQILGQYNPSDWPYYNTNLGKDFKFNITATKLAGENYGLFSTTEYEAINSLSALVVGTKYTVSKDTFDCRTTLLPDDNNCSATLNRAMYRVFYVDQDGIITIGGGRSGYHNYSLYKGNLSLLPTSGNEIVGPEDLACCQLQYYPFKVCVTSGYYTIVTYGDNGDINNWDNFWVQFNTFTSLFADPLLPEIMDTLSSSNTSIIATNDWFYCYDNANTIIGNSPCYGATKLIYREFYLNVSASLEFKNITTEFQNNDGNVYYRMFKGRISDSSISSLIEDCFKSFDMGVCDSLSSGWYTIVSYDLGQTFTDPAYCSNYGKSIGDQNSFSITINTNVDTPMYNTFVKAEKVNSGNPIYWQANGAHTTKIPKLYTTYSLGTDYFSCEDDLPFPTGIDACGASYNRTSYRVFTLSKSSYTYIYNLNPSPGNYQSRLYEGDITQLTAPYTILQECINNEMRLCLAAGTYTLVTFATDNHYGYSITPTIYLDSLGTSKYDHAANAYDFGDIPDDGIEYKGNLSQSNDIYGRSPSNDFFFCETDAQTTDPADAYKMGDITAKTLPTATNPRRNLWYTFTATGAGTIYVKVYNLTNGKTSYYTPFVVYESDNSSFPPPDSTLSMGLTVIAKSTSSSNAINFYRDPCSASTTKRYYVLVDNHTSIEPNLQIEMGITFDPANSGTVYYDHYSLANHINSNPTLQCGPPYTNDTLSTGAFTGCEGNLSCATSDATDQNSCGTHTIWYTFAVDNTAKIRINYTRPDASKTEYVANDIVLFQSVVDGDSTTSGLIPVTLSSVSKNGYTGTDLSATTKYTWGEACVSTGRYYFMITGCNFPTETVIPRIWLTEQEGDLCSNPIEMGINAAGTFNESMTVNCFTIGEAPGEDGSDMGCMGSPDGMKSGWFKVNITATTKLDLDIELDEYTNYTGNDFMYRIASGDCNSMTYETCVSDGLFLILNLKCREPGVFWIQVVMPDDATDSVRLNITATEVTDTTCVSVDPEKPKADFDFTAMCTDVDIEFENNSTKGSAVSYYWEFGDGYSSILEEPQHAYSAAGTYLAMLVVNNSIKTDTLYKYVSVAEKPLANFSVGNASTIFVGDAVSLSNSSLNTISTTTYYWDFCSGSSCGASTTNSTTANPSSITYSYAGEKEICLTVTNESCDSTFCKTIFVYPNNIFAGGPYDGAAEIIIRDDCEYSVLNIFSGGPYDGAFTNFLSGDCEITVLNIFSGGKYDGFDNSIVLCDTLYDPPIDSFICSNCFFTGGPYDGAACAFLTEDCPLPPNIYSGGPYDGAASMQLYSDFNTSFEINADTICVGNTATLIASDSTIWYEYVNGTYNLLAFNTDVFTTPTLNTSGRYTYYADNPYACSKVEVVIVVMDTIQDVDYTYNTACVGSPLYFTNQTYIRGESVASIGGSGSLISSAGTTGKPASAGQITFSSSSTLNYSYLYNNVHNQQNGWTANNSSAGTQWIQWTYADEKSVSRIYFWNRNDCCPEKAPSTVRLYYSTGSSWVLISTFTSAADTFDTGILYETLNTFAKKWKMELDVTEASAPQIGELQIYCAEKELGGDTYWDFGDGSTSTQNAPSHTFTSAGPHNVTLTINSSESCSSSISKSISLNEATITLGADTTLCLGNTFVIDAGNLFDSYLWMPNGETTSSINAIASGNYIVTVTDSNNCEGSDTINLDYYTEIDLNLGNDTILCSGQSIVLDAGTTNTNFLWAPNGETTQTITVDSSATYIVQVNDSNNCSVSDSLTLLAGLELLVTIIDSTNVSCFGTNDGSASVSVSGGAAPYQFSWNDALMQTDSNAINLSAGIYTVVVYDSIGCLGSDSVVISQPDSFIITSASTVASCGLADGTAFISISGGLSPYLYQWNDSLLQTNDTAINLSAGIYTVYFTDANNCIDSSEVIVNDLDDLLVAITDVSCYGANNGSAVATPMSGTSPYTYQWDDAALQTDSIATGLAPGNYSVVVTDFMGCTAIQNVSIVSADSIVLSITKSNEKCGLNNGYIVVTASGGTAPLTLYWDTTLIQSGDTIYNLTEGIYNFLAIDSNACTISDSVEIENINDLSVSIIDSGNASCYGLNNGFAHATASGGTPPYSFEWNDPLLQTDSIANNLSFGTYIVSIYDSLGCSTSDTIIITQPDSISISSITTQSTCGQANGIATATTLGGTAPYSFLWNDSLVQSNDTAVNLLAGIYKLIVTDAALCSDSISVIISDNGSLASSITDSNTVTSCYGENDAYAIVTPTGGTPPYNYLWDDSNNQTDSTATGLSAGIYSVTVTDSNACVSVSMLTITEPDSMQLSVQSTDISCYGLNNGSASVEIVGGNSPYTYLWNDVSSQTDSIASGLTSGVFKITITDVNGCVDSAFISISEPDEINITASSISSTCSQSNGKAIVSANGGSGILTYQWNDILQQTSDTAINLEAGNYTVVVTDQNGCRDSTSISIVNLDAPTATITNSINVNCFGYNDGSASVFVSGGTPPYQYEWNDMLVQTDSIATNLIAGTYMVTVYDSMGCMASDSVIISQPDSFIISTSSVVATCGLADGKASIVVSGGSSPYIYQWNDSLLQTNDTAFNLSAGVYTVSISDANNCIDSAEVIVNDLDGLLVAITDVSCYGSNNGSAVATPMSGTSPYTYQWNDAALQTDSIATGLAPGNYSVTVTDFMGCTAIQNVTILSADSILFSTSSSNLYCGLDNGYIVATASGGTAPLLLYWDTTLIQSGDTIFNLSEGTYSFLVIDSNACTRFDSVQLIATPMLEATASGFPASCSQANGSAIVSVSGGVLPYSYFWNDPLLQTNDTITGLSGGTIIVTVIDATNCMVTDTVEIENSEAIEVIITDSSNISCYGGSNGYAIASIIAGTSPYIYSWNDPSNQTDSLAINLKAGNYILTVTDSNGCSGNVSVNLTEPNKIQLNSGATSSICNVANGTAFVNASGGTFPYSYLWNDVLQQTLDTAYGLAEGTYKVLVVDNNNCQDSLKLEIINVGGLSVMIEDSTNIGCYGTNSGTAAVIANGSYSPFSYIWNDINSQNTAIAYNLFAGNYSVTVTDLYGCSDSTFVTLTQPDSLYISISGSDANCGVNNAWAYAQVNGGSIPYSYLWSDSLQQQTDSAVNLYGGTYSVLVSDYNACLDSASISLNALGGFSIEFKDSGCFLFNNGIITASAVNGTFPYTYLWNDSNQTSDSVLVAVSSGTYFVTITDANNCIVADSFSIASIEPDSFSVNISQLSFNCYEQIASCLANVTGGSKPYNYLWNDILNQTTDTAKNLLPGFYSVVVADQNGCQVSDSIQLDSIIPAQLTISNDTSICIGDTLVLFAYGGKSYVWTPVSNLSSIYTDTTIATPKQDITYMVTVTDSNNCEIIDSVSIKVDTLPTIDFTADTVCFGNATTFLSNTNKYIYLWDYGDGNSSTIFNPTYYYSKEGVYNTTLYVNSIVCKDSITKNVIVKSEPEAIFSIATLNGCAPHTIQIVDSSLMASTYYWNFGDGNTSNSNNPTHIFHQEGQFEITLVVHSIDNCIDSLTLDSLINVYPIPTADFILDTNVIKMNDPIAKCFDQSINGTSWYWDFGNDSISQVQNPFMEYADTGQFTIWQFVYNNYGCYDSTSRNILVKPDYTLFTPIAFTPNGDGLNDNFMPVGLGITENNFGFYIFDRWGTIVYETHDLNHPWNGKNQKSGKLCMAGIYSWKIEFTNVLKEERSYIGHINLLK